MVRLSAIKNLKYKYLGKQKMPLTFVIQVSGIFFTMLTVYQNAYARRLGSFATFLTSSL